ncbi:hypothetical protein [uncultured Erythrobacter sp.]|uniref:hypothetical protein n=1 Tax=uncultured Erythrobacter sp. TaxID=263913 RepID=UPI0026080D91|nr:hypothetical protein [uncultured Erythrobacter sp.]
MNEEFEFWVAQERLLPVTAFEDDTEKRIGAVVGSLNALGTHVGVCAMSIGAFAEAFERLGETMGVGDSLAQSAIADSPHGILPDDDLSWSMGFFSAETVELVQNVINGERDQLIALGKSSLDIEAVRNLFMDACEEASASGQAIVIIHKGE